MMVPPHVGAPWPIWSPACQACAQNAREIHHLQNAISTERDVRRAEKTKAAQGLNELKKEIAGMRDKLRQIEQRRQAEVEPAAVRHELSSSRSRKRAPNKEDPAWLTKKADGLSLKDREAMAERMLAPQSSEAPGLSMEELLRQHKLAENNPEHQRHIRVMAALTHIKGDTSEEREQMKEGFRTKLLNAQHHISGGKEPSGELTSQFMLAARHRIHLV